jgi:hypothetical protein
MPFNRGGVFDHFADSRLWLKNKGSYGANKSAGKKASLSLFLRWGTSQGLLKKT